MDSTSGNNSARSHCLTRLLPIFAGSDLSFFEGIPELSDGEAADSGSSSHLGLDSTSNPRSVNVSISGSEIAGSFVIPVHKVEWAKHGGLPGREGTGWRRSARTPR